MAVAHRWSRKTTMYPPRHYTADLLSEYDMKRDLAEINRKAPQSTSVVAQGSLKQLVYGATSRPYLSQNVINAEALITQKTSRSTEIRNSDLRRVASTVTSLPTPRMTDSRFLKALGIQTIRTARHKQES